MKRTHCEKGHLFCEENLDPNELRRGNRACKRCRVERDKVRKPKFRSNNPEKHRQEQRLYYERHKAYVKVRVKGNRKRRPTVDGSFTSKEWFTLCFAVGFCCLCCTKKFKFKELTPDHVVPLSRGGSNYLHNIQPLCLKCNMHKHTKTVDYRNEL